MCSIRKNFMWLVVSLALCVLLSTSPQAAHAQWTTIASAGTVDEADLDFIVFDQFFATAVFPGGTIRYNVLNGDFVSGNDVQTNGWRLTVRYIDGDSLGAATQRILLHLRELNTSTGEVRTILTFDSNERSLSETPQMPLDWQVRTIQACGPRVDPDAAYYIEAQITLDETPLAPSPHLGAITLSTSVVNSCP